MKDLNEAFGDDDFGLGRHGSELDNDERGMKKGYSQDPLVTQIGKIIDTRTGDNPITTVTTDDGQSHKVGPQMAQVLQALLKGQIGDMKPFMREKLQDKLQSSSRDLEYILKSKTGKEVLQKAEELVGLQDVDRVKDKSIY